MTSRILEKKLLDPGVEGKVVEVHPGPVITVYEFEPAPGVKVSRIVGLAEDLAVALSAVSIRIVAPIPGKSVVGIEIPNHIRETVYLKEIIDSGELGNLFFYDSVRVNLGQFQHDINVIWDLAPHDLSIMDYLIKEKPISVAAHGSVHLDGAYEDVAYVSPAVREFEIHASAFKTF